ncbi:MAG: hypothetical protein WC943_01295 [Elusimicrobiota bacterium]|jgi:hypothetical protein
MKLLRIIPIAAALLAAADAWAIPYLPLDEDAQGSGMVLFPSPEQDPEYQRIKEEVEAGLPMVPYTQEYRDQLIKEKTMERWQAARAADSAGKGIENPVVKNDDPRLTGDFLKGAQAAPESPAADQQALAEIGAADAVAQGNALLATGQTLAGLPAAGMPMFGMNAAGALMAAGGEQQAALGHATLDSLGEVESAIKDYEKFLDEARKEGVGVGAGFTITTYTTPDGRLMQTISGSNIRGESFPVGNPPLSLKQRFEDILKEIDAEKQKVAQAKAAAQQERESRLAQSSKSARDNGARSPDASDDPAGGEDAPGQDDGYAYDSEDGGLGAMGGTGADNADRLSAFSVDPTGSKDGAPDSGLLAKGGPLNVPNALESGFARQTWVSANANLERQSFQDLRAAGAMATNNVMLNQDAEAPKGGTWADGIISALAKQGIFWEGNSAKPLDEKSVVPAEGGIFPTNPDKTDKRPGAKPGA